MFNQAKVSKALVMFVLLVAVSISSFLGPEHVAQNLVEVSSSVSGAIVQPVIAAEGPEDCKPCQEWDKSKKKCVDDCVTGTCQKIKKTGEKSMGKDPKGWGCTPHCRTEDCKEEVVASAKKGDCSKNDFDPRTKYGCNWSQEYYCDGELKYDDVCGDDFCAKEQNSYPEAEDFCKHQTTAEEAGCDAC